MIKYSIIAMIGTAAIFTPGTDGAREGSAPNLTLIRGTWCCVAFFLRARLWAAGAGRGGRGSAGRGGTALGTGHTLRGMARRGEGTTLLVFRC